MADPLLAFRRQLLEPLESALTAACHALANGHDRRADDSVKRLAQTIRSSAATKGLDEIRKAAAAVEVSEGTQLPGEARRLLDMIRFVVEKLGGRPSEQPEAVPAEATATTPTPPEPAPVPPPPTPAPPPTPPAAAVPEPVPAAMPSTSRHPPVQRAGVRTPGNPLVPRYRHASEAQDNPLVVAVIAAGAEDADGVRRALPLTAAVGSWPAPDCLVAIIPKRTAAEAVELVKHAAVATHTGAVVGVSQRGIPLENIVAGLADRLVEAVAGGPGTVIIQREHESVEEEILSILLVERNDVVAAELSGWLEREGYFVQRCVDEADTLQTARRMVPNVVILDLASQDLPGEEVVARLRQIKAFRRVPVVLAGPAEDAPAQTMELVDWLPNPLVPADLAAKIQRIVREHPI